MIYQSTTIQHPPSVWFFAKFRDAEIVKPHDIIIHYPCHYELPVSNDQDFSFSIILSANLFTKQDSYPISERAKQVVFLWTVLTWSIPTVLRCPKVVDSAAHSGYLSIRYESSHDSTISNDCYRMKSKLNKHDVLIDCDICLLKCLYNQYGTHFMDITTVGDFHWNF